MIKNAKDQQNINDNAKGYNYSARHDSSQTILARCPTHLTSTPRITFFSRLHHLHRLHCSVVDLGLVNWWSALLRVPDNLALVV